MDHMDEIAATYDIQSLEQLRAIADELRVRILARLAEAPLTASEIAKQLGQPPNKIHYHVRELERVGLVRLVETREKGGVLEKVYRAVARTLNTPPELLQASTPDDMLGTSSEILRNLVQNWLRSLTYSLRSPAEPPRNPFRMLSLSSSHVWMTDEEVREVAMRISELVRTYEHPREVEGERERTFAWLSYDDESAERGASFADAPLVITPNSAPKRTRVVVAGAVTYRASDLEQALAAGKRLDILVVGSCVFDDAITAELVERAIARFRIRGALVASPEVREVLKRKEAKPKLG